MSSCPNKVDGFIQGQVSRLVVPFSFKMGYGDACLSFTRSGGEKVSHWKPQDFSKEKLFQHIDRLIDASGDCSETIGRRFVLGQEGRSGYGLPHTRNTPVYVQSKGIELQLFIHDVEIILFETNVGFVIFGLEYGKSASVETMIDGNYLCKNFSRHDINLFYRQKYYQETKQIDINLGRIAGEITKHLDVLSFFDNKVQPANRLAASHALVFNAVILDKEFSKKNDFMHELKKYLFFMRRSFKGSYKPAPAEFEIENNPEVMQFFENSYWGVSLEGLANIVYLVDDENTNKFFMGGYSGNLKNTYFYLYILALHQKYALMQFFSTATQLPYTDSALADPDNTLLDELNSLRRKIAHFIMRSYFGQVSNITHQKKLYEAIRQTLGIREMLDELHFELEQLAALTEMEEQKRLAAQRLEQKLIREEEQKQLAAQRLIQEELRAAENRRDNKFQKFIAVITTVFVLISTAQVVWEMYIYVSSQQYPALFSRTFWYMVVPFAFLCLITVYGVVYFTRSQGGRKPDH